MKKHRPIRKVLAANRSEIAIRIFRAANELGLRTVAIYSQEDRLALHRFKADEAYQVARARGPSKRISTSPESSRLPRNTRVDAIHPGYGFLSENPAFARACAEAGLTFVGPHAGIARTTGRQNRGARAGRFRRRSGAPWHAKNRLRRPRKRTKVASDIGYPVIVKAAMGGGGRGMRVVHDAERTRRPLGGSAGGSASPRSAMPPSSSRNSCRAPGISKCRFSATSTATCCIFTSATVLFSAAIRKSWRWPRRAT